MRRTRVLVPLVAATLFMGACSTGAGGETDDPPPAETAEETEAPAETADPTEPAVEATGIAKYEGMSEEEVIAAIREEFGGTSLIVGSSSNLNAKLVTSLRSIENLKEIFDIDAEFRFTDSNPMVASMIAGDVQVGGISLAGMANANEGGGDFRAFGVANAKNPFMVVAKGDIDEISDLKGMSFAVTQNLQQITGQTALKCLAEAGLTETDVQLIKLSNTEDTTQAIESGQVAAGVSADYRMTKFFALNGEDAYNVLCTGDEVNPQIGDVWIATAEWLEENPELALALNLSTIITNRWVADNKEEWIEYAMEKLDGYEREWAEVDYQNSAVELGEWPVNGGIDREAADQTLATSLEFGAITKAVETDDVVVFEFQDAALEILGER